MYPAVRLPSQTSTSCRPICRFCLDWSEEHSPLIRPCKCSGTVALVHSSCLEKWVETNKNLMCKIPYEQKSAGFKKISEWTLPRALSEDWDDKLDFTCAILWTFYLLRFVSLWISIGTREMNKRMSVVVGDGYFYFIWWIGFWVNTIYYGAVVLVIIDNWIKENSTYKFKDRSTDTERRELERKHSNVSVISEAQTNGARTEIRRIAKKRAY